MDGHEPDTTNQKEKNLFTSSPILGKKWKKFNLTSHWLPFLLVAALSPWHLAKSRRAMNLVKSVIAGCRWIEKCPIPKLLQVNLALDECFCLRYHTFHALILLSLEKEEKFNNYISKYYLDDLNPKLQGPSEMVHV